MPFLAHIERKGIPVSVHITKLEAGRAAVREVVTIFESFHGQVLTLTRPTLLSAKNLIFTAPCRRKAEAVKAAPDGPLSTDCPATTVFPHPSCRVFLDSESASLLQV